MRFGPRGGCDIAAVRRPVVHLRSRWRGATTLRLALHLAIAATQILACAGGADRTERLRADTGTANHPPIRIDTLQVAASMEGPIGPTLAGDRLWVGNVRSEPFIHAWELPGGRHLYSTGRMGDGPGEFRQILGLFSLPGMDDTLWVWDGTKFRLTAMVERLDSDPALVAASIIPFPDLSPRELMPLDDGRLLGFPGPPNSEFFSIYNMSGDYLGSPRVALPGSESVPLSARLQLLNGASRCARLDGVGFSMTYHLASIIQLYDRDGAFVRNAAVPVRSEEHFEPNPRSGKITFQRGIPHYSACAYSRDHLFAVYWGTSFTDEEPEGQTIHQFDLTGNFVRTLHVDAKFSYIAGRTVVSCPPPSLT